MSLKGDSNSVKVATGCYHCGNNALQASILFDSKIFCCEGCKTVYEILNQNNLCSYYSLNTSPGVKQDITQNKIKFDYLEDEKIKNNLLSFRSKEISRITFYIPEIHCSSCIWLLENLFKLHKGVKNSRVDFLKKQAHISFNEDEIKLSELASLLSNIGYEPKINLDSTEKPKAKNQFYKYYYKLGVAFFCFGNIMLLSFPEYFGISNILEKKYTTFFGYLNFLLSLPVLFYSASEFFVSAINGLKHKILNMDFPIALGIVVMFLRSSYEIFSHTGAGYMDTLACLVFLMLIGRMFQNKTYDTLSFERDYKSYFPISVCVLENGIEKNIPLANLKIGDRIIVRNEEIIPADAILFNGTANIDYAFVTGEAVPLEKTLGEIIYAGGKQIGSSIELEVIKDVSQSYLTQLWNEELYKKEEAKNLTTLANRVSRYFTIIILTIALGAEVYWMIKDPSKALNAFTAVLIITCPCALALSSPFTLGNALRIFGRKKLFLKNAFTIEKLSRINTIVFDKTGTLTQSSDSIISFEGKALSDYEKQLIKSLVKHSSHPLSQKIYNHIKNIEILEVSNFKEISGNGICGQVNEHYLKIGSQKFLGDENKSIQNNINSKVFVAIDGSILGCFIIKNKYREGLNEIIKELSSSYKVFVLSGDNDSEKKYLSEIIYVNNLKFNQSPKDKLRFIQSLQNNDRNVLMIGDGLNDAGALKQSNVGISISENTNNFSPACDGILDSTSFTVLPQLIKYSKTSINIIIASYIISFSYNIVGLYFAIQGNLSPLVAAILMPISSVSIVLFTTLATNYFSKQIHSKDLQINSNS